MAAVSLPPRKREFLETYQFTTGKTAEDISAICKEMETEVGACNDPADNGAIEPLRLSIERLYEVYEDEDDPRNGRCFIKDGKHQEFANLFRKFEDRLKSLAEQEEQVNFYLGKSTNKNTATDQEIQQKHTYLFMRMIAIRKEYGKFLYLFHSLTFKPHNGMYLAAIKAFASRFDWIGSCLKTTRIQTLVLGSFVLIAGYSIFTNTNTSLFVKAGPPLFFGAIGWISHKIFHKNLIEQPLQPQTLSITMSPSPPGSPLR